VNQAVVKDQRGTAAWSETLQGSYGKRQKAKDLAAGLMRGTMRRYPSRVRRLMRQAGTPLTDGAAREAGWLGRATPAVMIGILHQIQVLGTVDGTSY
jgi:hypothetical protein